MWNITWLSLTIQKHHSAHLLNPAILVIGAMVWQLISSSHFILGYLTTSINVKGISWQREMSTPRIGKTIARKEPFPTPSTQLRPMIIATSRGGAEDAQFSVFRAWIILAKRSVCKELHSWSLTVGTSEVAHYFICNPKGEFFKGMSPRKEGDKINV
jgi:hypothetical protein